MNKVIKRIIIITVVLALVAGGLWGGFVLLRKSRNKPVNVYNVSDFAMTDYWGDESEAYGMVTTTGLQNIYISETQQVTEIYVSEGQTVKIGDPIVSFDTTLTDIELEKARLNLEKLNLKLENVKAEQEYVNSLRPFSMVLVTPPQRDIVLVPETTPQILEGKGTETEPYYILWNGSSGMTLHYLETLFPKRPEPGQEDLPEGEESGETGGTADSGETGETDNEEEADEPVDYERVWAVFVIRDGNALNGQVLNYYGLKLDRSSGQTTFNVVNAMLPEYMFEYDKQEEPYYKTYGSSYTAKELETMKQEKEQEVKDVALQIQMAEVELQRLEREMQDGTVSSTVNGVVKAVRDADEARYSNEPLIELSAGGGYYVDISIGELNLDTVTIGMPVQVMSWENYMPYEGTIVEISEYPMTSADSWTNGNNNISWYPAKVYIDESAQLREYEYVSVTYSASSAADEGMWYLENMFIRTEGGVSYVMVRGENGRLERRIIQTGKSVWGSYTMIRGGITMDDRIAFPYGSSVFEGAETVEATADQLYNSY